MTRRSLHRASVKGALEFLPAGPAALVPVAALLALTLWGCGSTAPRFRTVEVPGTPGERRSPPRAERTYANLTPQGIHRDRLLLELAGYLGVPYEYGGTTKRGIDCSGLTQRVYQGALLPKLPRSTADQFRAGRPVEVESLMFGDLVFFNTTGTIPSHVGIYIEDDLFAHASVTNGVTFGSLEAEYYRERYVGARRIVR
jgi:cell wall-associated NlpC family hydrolase